LEARQATLLRGFGFDRPARRPDDRFDPNRAVYPDWTYSIDRGLVSLHIHSLPPHAATVSLPPADWIERFGWFRVLVEAARRDDYSFSINENGVAALLDSPLMERCLELDLGFRKLGVGAVRRLAQSPAVK